MTCDDDTVRLLKRGGHKITPQRLLIARTLRHASGHLTAAEVGDRVRKEYPVVDPSTVYRTLDVLRRLRVVVSTDLGTGDATYEWLPEEPHHHLVCSGCGFLTELCHTYLADLEARLRADHGFAANLDHFAIFGLCRDCQASGAPGADQA